MCHSLCFVLLQFGEQGIRSSQKGPHPQQRRQSDICSDGICISWSLPEKKLPVSIRHTSSEQPEPFANIPALLQIRPARRYARRRDQVPRRLRCQPRIASLAPFPSSRSRGCLCLSALYLHSERALGFSFHFKGSVGCRVGDGAR